VPEDRVGGAPTVTGNGVNGEDAVFGAYYYAHDCGIPYERNEHWLTFFGDIADGIVERLAPKWVLDVGCAMGFLVEALRARGVEAWGIDISEYAISNVHPSAAPYCAVSSAADELPAGFPSHFDLVTCIEVIEHLDGADAEIALANVCRWGSRVLFSSSSSDYGEPTHVNVKRGEQWAAAFAAHGRIRNFDVDVSFLTSWAVLYEEGLTALPAVVARYEREFAELHLENLQLRYRLRDSERVRGDLERVVAELRAELGSVHVRELRETRDKAVATEIRAQQLRQRLSDLEGQIEERERTLWELLSELEQLRPAGQRMPHAPA
jgi:SAM-dependent methyltransferase